MESGIHLKESGIPLKISIRNPGFTTDKDWNPVPGIRNPGRGIQNPKLSWIPLQGANLFSTELTLAHKAVSHGRLSCKYYTSKSSLTDGMGSACKFELIFLVCVVCIARIC